MQHGRLLKLSILTAVLASSDPALARRSAPAEDIHASVAASREGAPESSSTRARQRSTLPLRSNECLEQALVGETMPVNSQSMQDILDHCGLLGTGQPQQRIAADPQPDQVIYHNHCTRCHLNY